MQRTVLAGLVVLFLSSLAVADAQYLVLPLNDVPLVEGERHVLDRWWGGPRVRLDGEGEALVDVRTRSLLVRVPEARELTGTVYLPAQGQVDDQGRQVTFRIPADRFGTDPDARVQFYTGMTRHYDWLRRASVPGRAWFRHKADQARLQLPAGQRWPDEPWRDAPEVIAHEHVESFALFTGGRAVAENLALDRALAEATDDNATVALAGIAGITSPEFDWKPLLQDAAPELDPLASLVPHDQHAIFFPSVVAFETTMAAILRQMLPITEWTEAGSGTALVLNQYRRQLKLDRLLDADRVQSLAVTGSDSYFRTGTDVAVILQVADADAFIRDAAELRSEDDVRYFVGRVGDAVAVTNSLVQLQRLIDTAAGRIAPLSGLEEYRFFRQRYVRGGGETALLVLSDDTIRRWCGPRWRIASARRTRAMAQLAQEQARRMTQAHPQPVRDEQWGTLAFLTPIVEMPFDKVTPQEARGYERWRQGYERGWQLAFDPIALQLTIHDGRMETDLTVLPLIGGSDYEELVMLAGEASIGPRAGDPHDNTLLHVVMAIDPAGRQMQDWGQMMQMMLGINADPWAWLNQVVGLYIERDPVWQELADAVGRDETDEAFVAQRINRLPIALHAEVKSGMRLVAFLAGVRTFIEQSAPDMVRFNTRRHNEQGYVEVTVREVGIGDTEPRIYYLATNKVLVVSLSEALIHRAIDRHGRVAGAPDADAAAEANPQGNGGEAPAPPSAWLGEHLAANVEGEALQWITRGMSTQWRQAAQHRAWSAIPILNEWRRLAPDRDPVSLHEQLWHQSVGDPADYRWNDPWQTMESVAWGHPGEPRVPEAIDPAPGVLQALQRGSLGVTFEHDGLRAKAQLQLAP